MFWRLEFAILDRGSCDRAFGRGSIAPMPLKQSFSPRSDSLASTTSPFAVDSALLRPTKIRRAHRCLPLNSDIAFSETINWLGDQLSHHSLIFAARRHKALGLSRSITLPANEDRRCSRDALQFMKGKVEAWCKEGNLAGSVGAVSIRRALRTLMPALAAATSCVCVLRFCIYRCT